MSDVFRKQYRELGEEEVSQLHAIRAKANELMDLFEKCGPSRENSLAKTKLEEAVMWAVKGITA